MAAKKTPEKKTRQWAPEAKEEAARKRAQHRAISAYLDALPQRRNQRDTDAIAIELEQVATDLQDATGIERLTLVQRKYDLEAELATTGPTLADLEEAFIAEAYDFAVRKGISRAAFREVGVPASVLSQAGFGRTVSR